MRLTKLKSPIYCAGNIHGPMYIYQFTNNDLGPYEAPAFFPEITQNHAKKTEVRY